MLVRPLVAGLVAGTADYYFNNETKDLKSSGVFAVAVAVGVSSAEKISQYVPDFSMGMLSNGKIVEQRLSEVILAGVGAYGVNRFVFQQTPVLFNGYNAAPTFSKHFLNQVGIVAFADIIAEFATDWYKGEPLALFQ